MALNYLLSPEFQIVNSAGRPASGGFLEVYVHGTRDKYFCASDFDGTLHPFRVPLDSLGSNVVLASDAHAYDVYIYNRYGTLLMSRYNVNPSSGGSMGGTITSSDGSINVTPTVDGYDLSIRDNKASTLRAAADPLYADGFYSFRKLEGEGEAIYLDNGAIKFDDGWYHFSVTVKLNWNGNAVPNTGTIRLYSGLTYDIIDFDYSYNHSESILLDGDIFIGAHSSHYISFGRNFSLGITGMPTGMTAELVDCDLHSIIGQGVGGNGEKNIHRLLRYFTNSEEADADHPVGDWLHDLDAVDPADPSGHPMVTADQLFAWYDEGQIFDLYEGGAGGDITDWSAVYHMVTWQDQSDWWSQYATEPGKACRLEFYRAGMYSVPNRVGLIAYIRYKEEDYMRLYQIKPGQDIWMMELQEELPYYGQDTHNGEFLRVKSDGSGLEWVAMDLSDYVTETDLQTALSGKQDTLTAGSNITISGSTISATDTTYTAGTGLSLTGTEFSADTSVLATQSDLSGKQDTLTAGTGITIQNNVISATADQQVQSNWNETDTDDPSYIQNKPDLSIYATGSELSAGLATKQDTIGDLSDIRSGAALGATSVQDVTVDGVSVVSNGVAAITMPSSTQQQANWAESDPASVSYIQNKPDLSIYAESADLATVASTGSYNDLTNKPTIPAAQVNSDWNSSSGVSEILNKPDLSVYATQSDLNGKQDALTAGSNITIQSNVISATDTTYSAGTGIDITGTTISADTSVLATQSDLSGKQDTLTAGSNIQINGTTISATDTTYSAGTGIDITGTTISADTSVLATQQDLSGKQDVLTAGTNVQINNNVISATDTTYSAGSNIQINGTTISATDTTYTAGTGLTLNGTEFSADTTVLATQSDLSGKQDTLTAGSNISIDSSNVISATDTTYSAGTGLTLTGTTFSNADPIPSHTSSDSGKVLSVDSNGDLEWTAGGGAGGADWDATSGEPGYIENKPTPKVLTAGTNISISESASALTISATAAPQVQADWNESNSSAVSYIQNKPTEKTLAAGTNVTLTEANDVVTVSATDTTYTAGTGISISSNVISSGYNETVLWQADLTVAVQDRSSGTTFSLSETPANFEILKVYCAKKWPVTADNDLGAFCNEVSTAMLSKQNGGTMMLQGFMAAPSTVYHLFTKLTGCLTTTITEAAGLQATNGQGSLGSTVYLHPYRIVGVNRVASN